MSILYYLYKYKSICELYKYTCTGLCKMILVQVCGLWYNIIDIKGAVATVPTPQWKGCLLMDDIITLIILMIVLEIVKNIKK